jgi:hypothetical protein
LKAGRIKKKDILVTFTLSLQIKTFKSRIGKKNLNTRRFIPPILPKQLEIKMKYNIFTPENLILTPTP